MDNTIEMLQSEIRRLEQENKKLEIQNATYHNTINIQTYFIQRLEEEFKIAKSDAYKSVFSDLSQIGYLVGRYDAKHANKYFIMGAQNVMEAIAAGVSKEFHAEYLEMYEKNTAESKRKHRKQKRSN